MRQSVSVHGISLVAAIVTWMAAGSLLSWHLGTRTSIGNEFFFYLIIFGLVFGPLFALIRQGTITMPTRRRDGTAG